MAAQTVREHDRSSGKHVDSYQRRNPRGPKPRPASLMGAPAPKDHFTVPPKGTGESG